MSTMVVPKINLGFPHWLNTAPKQSKNFADNVNIGQLDFTWLSSQKCNYVDNVDLSEPLTSSLRSFTKQDLVMCDVVSCSLSWIWRCLSSNMSDESAHSEEQMNPLMIQEFVFVSSLAHLRMWMCRCRVTKEKKQSNMKHLKCKRKIFWYFIWRSIFSKWRFFKLQFYLLNLVRAKSLNNTVTQYEDLWTTMQFSPGS